MKSKQEVRAEILEMLGIDAILLALHEYCSGKNCNDCYYLNQSDGLCQVLEYITRMNEFPHPDEVPEGDKGEEEDPRADRRDWEIDEYFE